MTIGGAFLVMGGLILKLVERNIINQMNACHNKLHGEQVNMKEYEEDTRELAVETKNRIIDHVEKYHT